MRAQVGGIIAIFLMVLASGCATRGLNDQFSSVTEQRLVTQSLDKLVLSLPEKDFEQLSKQPVYLKTYFVERTEPSDSQPTESSLLNFTRQRLRMELIEKYACRVVDTPEDASYQLHFFFNAIGTDQDKLGLSFPPLAIPGFGAAQFDFLALEMFHGVSEGYYYIVDNQHATTLRGALLKSRVRTDRLNLPIVSIPLKTLD